jgi:hypothetical protein
LEQPSAKLLSAFPRQSHGNEGPNWLRRHCGQIAQIHTQRFPPNLRHVVLQKLEIDAIHEHVGRCHQLPAGR